MNYYKHKHPNYYYGIRTVVRFVFWTGLAGGLLYGASALGNKLADDPRPECDVTVNVDFTWVNNGTTMIDLTNCEHPTGIVLESDGTWRWYDPELDN